MVKFAEISALRYFELAFCVAVMVASPTPIIRTKVPETIATCGSEEVYIISPVRFETTGVR